MIAGAASRLAQASRASAVAALILTMAGCVTSSVQDVREGTTGIGEGESVVILAKSYHLGNETEDKYIACIEKRIARGSNGLRVISSKDFVDSLFPWFEPRTAPTDTKGLVKFMEHPGVAEKIAERGVRYVIWIDGDTERVAGGGSLSCAAGPGGGGCFGFAWWQKDADYDATIWDLKELESAGTVSADVSGTSFLPALIIPIPLIARTQAAACKGLSRQLRVFIADDPAT